MTIGWFAALIGAAIGSAIGLKLNGFRGARVSLAIAVLLIGAAAVQYWSNERRQELVSLSVSFDRDCIPPFGSTEAKVVSFAPIKVIALNANSDRTVLKIYFRLKVNYKGRSDDLVWDRQLKTFLLSSDIIIAPKGIGISCHRPHLEHDGTLAADMEYSIYDKEVVFK
jgi:hypothetical protein